MGELKVNKKAPRRQGRRIYIEGPAGDLRPVGRAGSRLGRDKPAPHKQNYRRQATGP
jgi:hypothetical protein